MPVTLFIEHFRSNKQIIVAIQKPFLFSILDSISKLLPRYKTVDLILVK